MARSKGANPRLPMLLRCPCSLRSTAAVEAIEMRRISGDITPLLAGATMFWQQRPAGTGDPVQQKVLMFMPVMFTAMFLPAPSGLVVYWFVSNLWAIGQQYFTNWMIGPPKAVAGVKR
jgi:membrane protein insertase Oxa1/YidC/SpoIIIJ